MLRILENKGVLYIYILNKNTAYSSILIPKYIAFSGICLCYELEDRPWI